MSRFVYTRLGRPVDSDAPEFAGMQHLDAVLDVLANMSEFMPMPYDSIKFATRLNDDQLRKAFESALSMIEVTPSWNAERDNNANDYAKKFTTRSYRIGQLGMEYVDKWRAIHRVRT